MIVTLDRQQQSLARRQLLTDVVYILSHEALRQMKRDGETGLSAVEVFLAAQNFCESSENANKYLSTSSYTAENAAALITRNDSIRPAVCIAENSLALPDVALASYLPWNDSVTPDVALADSYIICAAAISCDVSAAICLVCTI